MSTLTDSTARGRNAIFKLSADAFQNLAVLAIFLLMCVIVAIIEPKFLSLQNFSNVLMQVSSVIMVGSAVTMVLISGNLDLSVGAVGAMAGVLYAMLARDGMPVRAGGRPCHPGRGHHRPDERLDHLRLPPAIIHHHHGDHVHRVRDRIHRR